MAQNQLGPLIDAIVQHDLGPLLERIEKELGRLLVTSVVVIRDGVKGPIISVGGAGAKDVPQIDGEVRLRVRETYGGKRHVFTAEAVFRSDLSDTGFSGLVAKGDVRARDDGSFDVRGKTETFRYNVWEFSS